MYTPGSRIGQRISNLKGEKMIIIEDGGNDKLTVIFEDNTIVKGQTWNDFKSRLIRKPNDKEEILDFTGYTVAVEGIACNRECRCISFDGSGLTVRFLDNGEIVSGVTPEDFVEGNIDVNSDEGAPEQTPTQKNLTRERRRTLAHAMSLLNKYHRCAIIRPCGFGKTYINLKIFDSPQYKRCLYLSPTSDKSKHIKETAKKLEQKGKYIKVQTYAWLRGLSDEKLKALNFDIICFDECHNIGGDYTEEKGAHVTFLAVQKLMLFHPRTHFLGSTATQIRMDGIDVIGTVFLNHTVYPYNIDDAINDGFMQAPHYLYCEYNVIEGIRKRLQAAEKKIFAESRDRMFSGKESRLFSEEEMEHIFGSEDVQKINAAQMPKHIREACDELLDDTSYMRFIVFYLTVKEIEENKEIVADWFRKAYPDHDVVLHEYHSKSPMTKLELESLEERPNTVDLIFSCEKLTEEYHSDKDTGIIMDRRTQSYGLYIQMLGRIMTCDTKKSAIVFDIVDNLHSDFAVKPIDTDVRVDVKRLLDAVDGSAGNLNAASVPTTYKEAKRLYAGAVNWDRIAIRRNDEKIRIAKPGSVLIPEAPTKKMTMVPDSSCSASEERAAPAHNYDTWTHSEEEPGETNRFLYNHSYLYTDAPFLEEEPAECRIFEEIAANVDNVPIEQSLLEYTAATKIINDLYEPAGGSVKTEAAQDEDDSDSDEEAEETAAIARYKEILSDIKNEHEDVIEDSGFNSKAYVQYQGQWFQKSAKTRMRKADLDMIVYEIYQKPVKKILDLVLEKYDRYKPRYSTYEELKADKDALKLLEGAAWVYRIKPEYAIAYMIEGEVPKI